MIGTPYDKIRVTPSMDGRMNEIMAGYGPWKVWGLTVEINGLTAKINGGELYAKGRYVKVDAAIPVSVPANWTGNIVITIDLTKSNDSTGNPVYDNYSVTINQIYARCVADKDLRADDINLSGGVFDVPIARVTTNGTTITNVDYSNLKLTDSPNPGDIRWMATISNRVYEKIALKNVTVRNKYNDCNVTLRRNGRICFAKINFKPVTTLAWEQLLDINGFPGYRPDGGDYGGILNEMTYNTEPGGAYIAGTTLRVMHVGRTDVGSTTYSGVITYVTNDDLPPISDLISGHKSN